MRYPVTKMEHPVCTTQVLFISKSLTSRLPSYQWFSSMVHISARDHDCIDWCSFYNCRGARIRRRLFRSQLLQSPEIQGKSGIGSAIVRSHLTRSSYSTNEGPVNQRRMYNHSIPVVVLIFLYFQQDCMLGGKHNLGPRERYRDPPWATQGRKVACFWRLVGTVHLFSLIII